MEALSSLLRELELLGIKDQKSTIKYVIKEIAKEVFYYDEKAYIKLLEKYNVD